MREFTEREKHISFSLINTLLIFAMAGIWYWLIPFKVTYSEMLLWATVYSAAWDVWALLFRRYV